MTALRFEHRYADGKQLEALIVESGQVHESVIHMREALGRDFKMSDLQNLPLGTLCGLYIDKFGQTLLVND